MKKRILPLLLAIALVVGMLPAAALAEGTAPSISKVSMSLTGILSINFKVDPGSEEDMSTYTLNATVGDDTNAQVITNPTVDDAGLYVYTVSVPAHRLLETVTVKLMDGATEVDTLEWVVAAYAAGLKEQEPDNAEQSALLDALVNYAAYADAYADGTTAAVDVVEAVNRTAFESSKMVIHTVDASLGLVASLYLDDACDLRFKFNTAAFDGCTLLINGEAVDASALTTEGAKYVYAIAEILPQNFDEMHNIKIVKGEQTLANVDYSVLSYAYSALGRVQEAQTGLNGLLKSMYLYGTAADAYISALPAEPADTTLNFAQVSYGTSNLIQVKTNLPAATPCVSFTANDNGCNIDQSGNQYQQFGWAGMDLSGDTVYLTFHFNSAFEAGQTYVLPAGAVFGFTDGSSYTLDADYTFTWDGASWTMEAVEHEEPAEDALTFQYRYGAANLIQVNTNLPSSTPCVDFLATDNGCNIDQSINEYQQFGWAGMTNADGTIVLTFNFGSSFTAGQTYKLPAGAVFGFTDGSSYTLDADYTFTWDGASWTMEATKPAPVETTIALTYRYGAANLIQFNTNLPATTPLVNFLATDNGCNILQSGDQQVGYIAMLDADGTIVLTFNFNNAFEVGQSYTLSAGSVFGFTDGSSYTLEDDITLYWDGNDWTAEQPVPEVKNIALTYRYGAANLIQFNTDLPATTPLKDFLAADNGCDILQTGDQQVGYISMLDADGTIVLTFNFNNAFEVGQSYTLSAGSVFGFTDGSSYTLTGDITLYWDGSAWSTTAPVIPEPPQEDNLTFEYRYGTANLIQVNTNLPASTPIANFLTSDNGCSIDQTGNTVQWIGWIGMTNADGTIVLTFNFNSAFTAGQTYVLPKGAVFGFTDGNKYTLNADYTFTFDGANWTMTAIESAIDLTYRYGTNMLIQYNTNLPAATPIANFLPGDNGGNLIQSGDQSVGWIGMADAEGTIVLTFNFNGSFAVGQSYTLEAGSVFGFTDGSSYTLDSDITLYWDGNNWSTTAPVAPETDVLDESNFTGGKDIIAFADLPVDAIDTAKIEEYKALGFNTSLLTEDHTGTQGPDENYRASMATANEPQNGLNFAYRWGTANLIQVNTNLPATTPLVNFTAGDNGCNIDQSGNQYQQVGWIGMANAEGTIVLTFNFNSAFSAGQTYVLPKGAVFGFTDGNQYTLDADYTFTFDGTNWSMNAATLKLSLSAGAAKYIQLKTDIPTGLTYGDFLLGDTSKGHNVILETTEGAQSVAWFSYSELSGAVYLTFNFSGYNKPGTQYILKSGTSLKAGDNIYTTDRDYILTVQNDYLTSLENLDKAGLKVWIRNHHNKADYFTDALTAVLKLYETVIDGFYMVDEAFQTNALLNAAGQAGESSDFESMTVVRDWFNQNFADKYYHSNQVPVTSYDHYNAANGSSLSAMDADAYRAFLQAYKQTYNDQLTNASGASVSFDNYPFVRAQGTYRYGTLNLQSRFESGIQSTYLLNSLIAAQVAAEDDFGLCIQTFEAADLTYGGSRDITSSAEISLQLYTGMAMGADLFEYFAYNSNDEIEGILNLDGSQRIYGLVKEGNEALCFADVVNTFTWNGIVTSAGSANHHNGDAFTYVENMILTNISNGALASYTSTDDAVIGCFTKGELNGYMVVNYNDPAAVTGNNTVNLTFADCARARIYTCVDSQLISEVVELANGSCTVTLAPGSGCFVIPA